MSSAWYLIHSNMAAKTLTEPGHTGRAYELTGPAAMTPREQVAAIAEAIGEPIEAERRISPDVERLLGRTATDFAAWAERQDHQANDRAVGARAAVAAFG